MCARFDCAAVVIGPQCCLHLNATQPARTRFPRVVARGWPRYCSQWVNFGLSRFDGRRAVRGKRRPVRLRPGRPRLWVKFNCRPLFPKLSTRTLFVIIRGSFIASALLLANGNSLCALASRLVDGSRDDSDTHPARYPLKWLRYTWFAEIIGGLSTFFWLLIFGALPLRPNGRVHAVWSYVYGSSIHGAVHNIWVTPSPGAGRDSIWQCGHAHRWALRWALRWAFCSRSTHTHVFCSAFFFL